jgi:hypothetical protein
VPQKKLDFLVIGAPKSATTSLYELLKEHPQLAMPATKEVPFFTDHRKYAKGMARYLAAQFPDASPEAVWGTITPQYMQGQGEVDVALTARRIADELPFVKIVALLRDPIDRAFSHYKMQLQRGYERRSFDDVVRNALGKPLEDARGPVDPEDGFRYIFVSEYGRILQLYYDLFPREQILVLTTDELKDGPTDVVRRMCTFLSVSTQYEPVAPSTRARHGGVRPRSRLLTPGFIYGIPGVKRVWKNAVPARLRNRVEYRTNLWNIRPDEVRLDRGSYAYRALAEFFAADVAHVEQLTGITVPWPAWSASRPAASGQQSVTAN